MSERIYARGQILIHGNEFARMTSGYKALCEEAAALTEAWRHTGWCVCEAAYKRSLWLSYRTQAKALEVMAQEKQIMEEGLPQHTKGFKCPIGLKNCVFLN